MTSFRRKRLRLITSLFVVLLVGCTLAGNTLRNLALPKVYLVTTGSGTMVHQYEGTATVSPVISKEIVNPAGWKVTRILVQEGNSVTRGQTLILYDDRAAREQLLDLQTEAKKSDLSMSLLQRSFIEAATSGDVQQEESATVAIETFKLDQATQQRRIERLEQSLEENRQSVAPFDGVVIRLNAVVGFASSGLPELVLADMSKGFELVYQVPGNVASLLEIGETMDKLMLLGTDTRQLTGQLVDIQENLPELAAPPSKEASEKLLPAEPSSTVRIAITDTKLQGGERVQVAISKQSVNRPLTLPNEAVHYDERGAYVFTLQTDSGPLGNTYRVVKTPVEIADRNSFVTGIAEGLFNQQEVVLHSSKDFLMDGMRVRR